MIELSKRIWSNIAGYGKVEKQAEVGLVEVIWEKERIQAAACRGDPEAQFDLSLMYEKGEGGVSQDKDRAYQLLFLAVVQNYEPAQKHMESDAEALFNVGRKYNDIEGIGNITEAIRLWNLAVKKGHGGAAYVLASIYFKGLDDLPIDEAKAERFLCISANLGDILARDKINELYQDADLNSQYDLASLHAKQGDFDRANALYLNAAEKGHAGAQFGLGALYLEGTKITRDVKKSIEWYEKSALQGHVEAQHHLGLIYMYGEDKNIARAKEFFRKAAEQGHANAAKQYAALLFDIENPQKNRAEVIKWLTFAAKHGIPRAAQDLDELQLIWRKNKSVLSLETKVRAIKQQSQETTEENMQKISEEEFQRLQKQIEKETEKNKKREEAAKKRAEKLEQEKPRTDLKDLLQNIITEIEHQVKPKVEKFQKDTDGESFEVLKRTILDTIKMDTNKLAIPLIKNKVRLSKLELTLKSLDKLLNLNDKIKITEVWKEMENLLQLCKGLQGVGLSGKILTPNEQATLIKKFQGFLKLSKLLTEEMDISYTEPLKRARINLSSQWLLFVTKYNALVKCMKDLEKLDEEVSERTKKVAVAYRTSVENMGLNAGELKTGELDAISQMVKTLQEKTKQLSQLPETVVLPRVPRSRTIQPGISLCAADIEDMSATVHVIQPPVGPQTEKITKAERIAQHKQKCVDAREHLRREEERTAINDYRIKTEEESIAGKLPVPERRKPDVKIPIVQNEQLRKPLDRLQSIIEICKQDPDVGPQNKRERQKKVYALLLRLGQVTELFAKEKWNEDFYIAIVARRFRNAIFKLEEEIQMYGLEELLSMATCWHKFLQKNHLGYFKSEVGVLSSVAASKVFEQIYALGKKLDVNAIDKEDFLRIRVEHMDIAKSRQTIRNMKAYWIARIQEKQRQKGAIQEIQKVINTAADKFCIAIMGSELAALDAAKKQNKPGAAAALNEFQELKPFLPQIREMGAYERHAEDYIEEQDETVRVLLAIESIDEPLCAAAKSLDKPFFLSGKHSAYDDRDVKETEEEHSREILFQALDAGGCDNEYLQELLLKVNANAEESSGRTLLQAACQNAKIPKAFIKALLAQEADPNSYMCVAFVVENGRKDIIELLLENPVKSVKPEIWTQVKSMYGCFVGNGAEDTLIKLLEKGEMGSQSASASRRLRLK